VHSGSGDRSFRAVRSTANTVDGNDACIGARDTLVNYTWSLVVTPRATAASRPPTCSDARKASTRPVMLLVGGDVDANVGTHTLRKSRSSDRGVSDATATRHNTQRQRARTC
jgi:hypothetical protein